MTTGYNVTIQRIPLTTAAKQSVPRYRDTLKGASPAQGALPGGEGHRVTRPTSLCRVGGRDIQFLKDVPFPQFAPQIQCSFNRNHSFNWNFQEWGEEGLFHK